MNSEKLAVYAADDNRRAEAGALADHLGVTLITEAEECGNFPLFLRLDEDGLTLSDGKLELRGDFTKNLSRLRYNNLTGEMLVKAAKLKNTGEHPLAVDCTAGMGEDSLLLAASGFRVILFEYDPVIAALLGDTLKRSADVPELADAVGRMTLVEGDSIRALGELSEKPDVIYLDPMFPERQKSALVKRKFQLLQQLEQPCSNEEDLMHAAIAVQPHKIVVKRPLKGPILAGAKPSYALTGKAIRYDVYMGTGSPAHPADDQKSRK